VVSLHDTIRQDESNSLVLLIGGSTWIAVFATSETPLGLARSGSAILTPIE